ncbi:MULTISPECIES: glycoside hydrolase family 16 protein [unclassified Nocardioides]|uniref:glycoside hydrolase family 16 protein n=1 Tax=unclassified Nocardioides TaxID=2615069 RepID=UPI0012E33D58|nr:MULTISPECIES: glycoside hydrolase family 16 protein [unclassified Nocardioides]
MRSRALVVALLCVVALALPVDRAAAGGRATPVLDHPAERSASVLFTGRTAPRAVVRLQVRAPGRWQTVRTTRAARSGAYRIATTYPSRPRSYRVVSRGRASAVRQVGPRKVAATPAPVPAPAPTDECGVRPRRADGSYYACSFHDEFGGETLDTSKWLVQETSYSGMSSGNRDCYVNDPATIAVASGTLRVTARRQLEAFTCASPYGDFRTTSTAGTVSTRDRFGQAYGRFEFRAKLPAEPGVPGPHSALWLYPQAHTYGAWPHSGEVDVAEWFSARPGNVYPSVHYAGEVIPESSGGNCAMPTSSSAFHTYAVEWTTQVMRFYYDGRLCYSHVWNPLGLTRPQPFDQPFNLVVTQVWGHLWNAPTDQTAASATIEVDWVRAWR